MRYKIASVLVLAVFALCGMSQNASAATPLRLSLLPGISIPEDDIVVGFDRKISSCCFDASFSIPLGMYEGDLLRNWWSKEMVEFRELHNTHKRTEIDICKNCTFA